MKLNLLLKSILCVFLISHGSDLVAKDVWNQIAPKNVYLGMPLPELSEKRPQIFRGPIILPTQNDNSKYSIYMETGAKEALHTIYWYFISSDKVVGVMRVKSLKNLEPDSSKEEAKTLYASLVTNLGEPERKSVLRHDAPGLVPVRVDKWIYQTETIYLIATNQELTVGIVQQGSFPIKKVLIDNDDNRFKLAEPKDRTISDLDRQ